jgi:polyisoprenoid-binding protein YceI
MSTAPANVLSQADVIHWDIDPSHSSAHFSVRHLMISNVRGEFARLSGSVTVDPRDITRSTVHAVIDAASVNTRDEKRDEHLRSGDFLDVANHPTIEFRSTRVTPKADGSLQVAGELTIRGVTREVVLEVEDNGELQDPWGNTKRGATATTRLDRKNFGLQWNVALETGGWVVGDDVKVDIEVELLRK